MNNSYRYEGLVNYIASRYGSAVEIGIGHFPDVAFALLKKGMRIFATDVRPFQYTGLKVIVDDIMEPNLMAYYSVDLIYSLRPPPELIPYMVRLARKLSIDLIIKPLVSEHPGEQLMIHANLMSRLGWDVVIPARLVASGDSPRRESFFWNDSRQAGVTEKETDWRTFIMQGSLIRHGTTTFFLWGYR